MAASVSPATGRAYGVARVCRVWDAPRSSFYAAQAPARPTGRRAPKPALLDADLLTAIRADLARSPWSGEGHRKVWARLRVLGGLRVARKRVLRLMREHALPLRLWRDGPDRRGPRRAARRHPRPVRDCQEFRVWAGIVGTQETPHATTQTTRDRGLAA